MPLELINYANLRFRMFHLANTKEEEHYLRSIVLLAIVGIPGLEPRTYPYQRYVLTNYTIRP